MDLQQAFRQAAKRTGMAVRASTQGSVLGLAGGFMLDSDAGPVIDRVLKAVVGRQAAHYNDGLARASRDRRHAAETSQGLIVSSLHGIMRLCEQCSEDDPAYAWKRVQDVHVKQSYCPRFFLRTRQGGRQAVHFAVKPGKLLAGDGQLRPHHLHVGHSSFAGARAR